MQRMVAVEVHVSGIQRVASVNTPGMLENVQFSFAVLVRRSADLPENSRWR